MRPLHQSLLDRMSSSRPATLNNTNWNLNSNSTKSDGNEALTWWEPGDFFNWDTWKTGCIEATGGSDSLYATLPILSSTRNGGSNSLYATARIDGSSATKWWCSHQTKFQFAPLLPFRSSCGSRCAMPLTWWTQRIRISGSAGPGWPSGSQVSSKSPSLGEGDPACLR